MSRVLCRKLCSGTPRPSSGAIVFENGRNHAYSRAGSNKSSGSCRNAQDSAAFLSPRVPSFVGRTLSFEGGEPYRESNFLISVSNHYRHLGTNALSRSRPDHSPMPDDSSQIPIDPRLTDVGSSVLSAAPVTQLGMLATEMADMAREKLGHATETLGTNIFDRALEAGVTVSLWYLEELLDEGPSSAEDCTFNLDETDIESLDASGETEEWLSPTAHRFRVRFAVTCGIPPLVIDDGFTLDALEMSCSLTFEILKQSVAGAPPTWHLNRSDASKPQAVWRDAWCAGLSSS